MNDGQRDRINLGISRRGFLGVAASSAAMVFLNDSIKRQPLPSVVEEIPIGDPISEAPSLDFNPDPTDPTLFENLIVPEGPVILENPNLFDRLMEPFVKEAEKLREERRQLSPEYERRIDWEFNRGRINFALYGYGETHEPPATERGIIGSHTIISYNTRTRKVDIVSLTHDIRAPEIERFKKARGETQSSAMKNHQAYPTGGFDLMREVLEDATGLSCDFQIAFRDRTIAFAIDRMFGRIPVDVPLNFRVHPYYLDGKKYPASEFRRGRQELTGEEAIQYIKTVPIETTATYDKRLEHNARKYSVLSGVKEALKANAINPLFWVNAFRFVKDSNDEKLIDYDFDSQKLLQNNIGWIFGNLGGFIVTDASGKSVMPEMGKNIYIHDPKSGAGGVQWVNGNADINPSTRRDINRGEFPDRNMAVPLGSNSQSSDLVKGYWWYLRSHIKRLILS